MDLINKLSNVIGTTEPALRLLITVFAGYPLAFLYRKYIYGTTTLIQHFYFILTGLSLGYWNYGFDIFHTVFVIFFTYLILLFIGGTTLSVAIVFIFNMVYLLGGYYIVGTESYDINWTMPQCVVCLRLIGTAFDLLDGQQPYEKLGKINKKTALKYCPNILEFFGHCFFPAGFIVGPQFPMKRYQDYVAGKFGELNSEIPALKRFTLGMIYLIIFQLLGLFVNDNYMISEEFANLGLFRKMLLLGLWGRYTLYKYISCWLLTEGACILFGISFNGVTDDGEKLWNGLENIKLKIFENTTQFTQYIDSFNVNTNNWLAQYIYKRLKFLGNRHLSQLGALLFLAVWHGVHSGYYVCFFFEFVVVYMERDIKSILKNNSALNEFLNRPPINLIIKLILRIYTFVFMGWCLLPFALLTFERYWRAFAAVNYIGIILFIMWPIIYAPAFKYILRPSNTMNYKKE